jgi:phospholipid/cholesterol/gamma-HCH transport system ATP-binding protein
MSSGSPSDASVVFERVHMAYGDREVFRDLSCRMPAGKLSVVLGGSGSGKSTALRLIGGLVRPQSGRILVGGEDVARLSERELYRVRQKLGMMFQQGALLDGLSVFDNLAFPLREHADLREEEVARLVHERLAAVGLKDVDDLLPSELSGGMVKRVALARAIIRSPAILLCDEPFSGLDPISVRLIEALLVHVNRSLGITMVVVSHHIATTMRSADHVILLLPNAVIEGTPEELERNRDPRVVAFLSEEPDPSLAEPAAAGT